MRDDYFIKSWFQTNKIINDRSTPPPSPHRIGISNFEIYNGWGNRKIFIAIIRKCNLFPTKPTLMIDYQISKIFQLIFIPVSLSSLLKSILRFHKNSDNIFLNPFIYWYKNFIHVIWAFRQCVPTKFYFWENQQTSGLDPYSSKM